MGLPPSVNKRNRDYNSSNAKKIKAVGNLYQMFNGGGNK
jgi:hypothetical protein